MQVELHDRPVAAEIGNRLDLPEWNCMDGTVLVSQSDRAQRHPFDGAPQPTGVDVLADPERIFHQEEKTRNDVSDEALCTKADGNPENSESGEKRSDIKAECRQRHD